MAQLEPAQAARVRPIFVSVDPGARHAGGPRALPAESGRRAGGARADRRHRHARATARGDRALWRRLRARSGAARRGLYRVASDVAVHRRPGGRARCGPSSRPATASSRSSPPCGERAAELMASDPRVARRSWPKASEGGRVSAIFAGAGLSTTGYLMSYTVNALIAEALHVDAALVGVPVGGHGARYGDRLVAADARPRLRRQPPGDARSATCWRRSRRWRPPRPSTRTSSGCSSATALVFGVGYGANRIARYSAAALYPAARRGTVIGWIVWAATIGAVVGPSLLELASQGAEAGRSRRADRPLRRRRRDDAAARRR